MHYQRQRIHGITVDPRSPWQRFWRSVKALDSDGCWEWQGHQTPLGYGRFGPGGSRPQQQAHRVAWEMIVGPIPEGLEIDHLCRNPSCVNPRHLEPVTHDENMRRARGWKHPNHRNVGRTQCPHGHAYDEANTYYNGKGDRICKACNRRRSLENYYRSRTASGN